MQGAYNGYAAIKTFWYDTTQSDNLRGADATGVATPGAQEIVIDQTTGAVTGNGNTTHTFSRDSFY